jgi:hypothetical protein
MQLHRKKVTNFERLHDEKLDILEYFFKKLSNFLHKMDFIQKTILEIFNISTNILIYLFIYLYINKLVKKRPSY